MKAVLFLAPCALGFEFLSIGDWGDASAKEVAPYMAGDLVNAPEWVIGIGDNFYSKGVQSVDDPQFKDKFEDTFVGDKLQIPWYLVSGNHDYYGGDKGIAAEIEYTNKSTRWNMPAHYYDKVLTGKDGVTVHLIGVDTWRLNGGDTYVAYDVKTGRMALRNESHVHHQYKTGVMEKAKRDILLKMFEEDKDAENPVTFSADQAQLTWLDTVLKNTTADWKVVMGHFPVYSCTTGEHGDTPNLIKYLLPVLQDNKVDMYFNGHDHILQHILKDGIHFFGSGAGAMKHTGINSNYTGLMGSHTGHYGFMIHDVSKTEVKTTFVDDQGTLPYTYTITK